MHVEPIIDCTIPTGLRHNINHIVVLHEKTNVKQQKRLFELFYRQAFSSFEAFQAVLAQLEK